MATDIFAYGPTKPLYNAPSKDWVGASLATERTDGFTRGPIMLDTTAVAATTSNTMRLLKR